MIIWLNGPFGSGKTHTANELKRRLDNSIIFDPEEVGYFIRNRMIHDGELPDFQDYKLWRDSTRYFLESLDVANRIVLVPMTVTNKQYLSEILDPLKDKHKVLHITLIANKETLQNRLLKRGDKKSSWTYKLIDNCLKELNQSCFKEHVATDNKDLYEVVDYIGETFNLNLLKDNRNKLQKKLGRLNTTIKHLRVKELVFKC
ncbi:MAG: AAA family ATPase [Spirochaetaceae bacterium]